MFCEFNEHKKSSSSVDAMHQVIALHVRLQRSGQLDGASIVNKNVNSSEFGNGGFNRFSYLTFISNIDNTRQSLSTSIFN